MVRESTGTNLMTSQPTTQDQSFSKSLIELVNQSNHKAANPCPSQWMEKISEEWRNQDHMNDILF